MNPKKRTARAVIKDVLEGSVAHPGNEAGRVVAALKKAGYEIKPKSTRQLHTDALEEFLRRESDGLASRPLTDLLSELADYGLAWRDIARLVGVSVPALRKWRQGEPATGENRLKVARLVGLCHLLKEHGLIDDPASWLELPLVYDVPVSGIDLLAAGRTDLLFRRALHHDADPEAILDEFDPDWRATYRGAFEVFEAEDGLPGLRIRDVDG